MKLFHDLLDAQGYETLQTREGLQALAIAREHRPDLILMDIQLPEISGLEVTKWLKEDDELSAHPRRRRHRLRHEGRRGAASARGGCEAYISKPISVTQLPRNHAPVRWRARPMTRAHPGRRRHRGQRPACSKPS